jgi:endonuclease/exonuclease/phosphatase family metal-dependent hydrolase
MPRALPDPVVPDLTREKHEIAVLTYNVQALPLGLGKDAPSRMKKIRPLVSRYDVVLFQEAFFFKDDLLGHFGGSAVSVRGRGAGRFLPKPRLTGAGLAITSFLGRASLVERHARRYDICSGTFSGYNDCLGRKGFVLARLRLAGVEVDVYTTHLDAGNSGKDRSARSRQLDVLARQIQQLSGDRPIILGGDLNSQENREDDMELLAKFRARVGLIDAEIRDYRGWDEHLDYIFYRSGAGARLTVVRKGADETFQTKDYMMSDHPALYAIIRIEPDSVRR